MLILAPQLIDLNDSYAYYGIGYGFPALSIGGADNANSVS
jgi:hypothetical protein